MSGVVQTVRLSARAISRHAGSQLPRRAFTASSRELAASNFTMPALSPTMTEGNIAQWRIKEGDNFSAGDVLLEIETDKATMDVEAQDDGILVKVTVPNESKGVKVGQRIAIMAESGDDVNSLELPKEDTVKEKPSPSKEAKDDAEKKEDSASSQQSKPSSKPEEEAGEKSSQRQTEAPKDSGKPSKQTYPLYPSVQHLLHTNGLSNADADKIPASGPKGRLLKGDVLAYLGQINKDYPAESSARLRKLSHLDLSNIKLATPAQKAAKEAPSTPAAEPEIPKDTELALPISLSAVFATQKRIQESLNVSLPLSTFITRASDLANEDLPLSKRRQPTSEQLFNSVLGLPSAIPSSSRGRYIPQISTPAPPRPLAKSALRKSADILDILAAPSRSKATAPKRSGAGAASMASAVGENVFSVSAKQGDERRAQAYLERMKLVLEQEPGRLVL